MGRINQKLRFILFFFDISIIINYFICKCHACRIVLFKGCKFLYTLVKQRQILKIVSFEILGMWHALKSLTYDFCLEWTIRLGVTPNPIFFYNKHQFFPESIQFQPHFLICFSVLCHIWYQKANIHQTPNPVIVFSIFSQFFFKTKKRKRRKKAQKFIINKKREKK